MASLYAEVVAVTEAYLGPAAERFITRQITSHLDKTPDELVPSDLPKLAEWSKVTLALLTSDRSVVHEFDERLRQLGVAALNGH